METELSTVDWFGWRSFED